MPTADGTMMTAQPHRSANDFARLAVLSVAVALALSALGWFPTRRVAGSDAWLPMLAGIGVSLIASLVAAIPLAGVSRKPARERHTVTLMAMALRMAVTMALLLSIVFGSEIARKPFVLWAGISYLALLAVETAATVRLMQTPKP